ncbi:uncharacterized protein FIBRA_01374 [Fibroporia radiculosa]|uniref:AB hydrolase-1 domain-containing protein n=1 Tax=Fibroporia radiculosa TaxID=599839 RepID=J4I8G2_9APHY|nr:uncharacterized protein FIBRA_01374 [Fibroporia radiculosa]CCL99356.1 predicted protein [Fibroporia radiculosa]
MESASYKTLTTGRGFKYNYYFSAGTPSKPTLLFVHGFPSTSYDWRHQISFFQKEGFTVIAPDALGYGGTDKPEDPISYKHSGMAVDLIDVLNAEMVDKAIAIGHDWGSALVARLASYFPERFLAFAFLAVGYSASHVNYSYSAVTDRLAQTLGYNPFGYWRFFTEEGAADIIMNHWDSALSLIYPADPMLWKEHLCPPGAAKEWLLAEKVAPPPSYLTEKAEVMTSKFADEGIAGGLNWYKVFLKGIAAEDDKRGHLIIEIPETNHVVQQPVFYGGGKSDYATLPAIAYESLKKYCPNITIKEFDTGHWIQLQAPDEVNRELLVWIMAKAKL